MTLFVALLIIGMFVGFLVIFSVGFYWICSNFE